MSNASSKNPFAGRWTYRSFRNDPAPVGDVSQDPSKLVSLLFAEGEWIVEDAPANVFKGQLQFGPGAIMDLNGTVTTDASGTPRAHIVGQGRPGTSMAPYFYDYDGWLAYTWPNGVNQRPAIVGSVIRAKPHDGAPAGYVASFIAVKKN